jgi:hypothetical protein
MSYFIPRPRHFNVDFGEIDTVTFPSPVQIRIPLRPKDLFGASDLTRPRYAFVRGTGNAKVWFDANLGRSEAESSDHLPPFHVEGITTPSGMSVSMTGHELLVSASLRSFDQLPGLVNAAEFFVIPMLTLHFGTFIGADEVTVVLDSQVQLRAEVSRFQHFVTITDETHRRETFQAALAAVSGRTAFDRFFYATLYYQQAKRLASGLENNIPDLNASEILVNLAKAVEILFGGSREKIREGCRGAGLEEEEIEAHVIPIVLARNQLDGAHPVGTRVSQNFVDTLREFVGRAEHNVRSLLVRIHRRLVEDNAAFLAPLAEDSARVGERERLIETMRTYLAQDGLRT